MSKETKKVLQQLRKWVDKKSYFNVGGRLIIDLDDIQNKLAKMERK